jgi:hypothetical protein
VNSAFPPFSFIHLSPHSWNSFNRSLFSIYIHSICTIFTFLQPFPISSPLPLVPTSPGRTCFTLLPSNFVIKKRWRQKWHFWLRWQLREFPCGTSMYTCIIAQFDSIPLFFFYLP